MPSLEASADQLRQALAAASRGLVERENLVEVIALAAVAREHVLVIGAPGTAKSEAVRRVARAIGGSYFEYLLGRFTEPSEVFGPIDLQKLKTGVVETQTSGMLPEAEVAFLDEVFLGSTAILNTLLGILNERVFRRGHTLVQCPLRVCVGASNSLPEEESLAAFADRFLVRVFVEPIADPLLEELLEAGWGLGAQPAAKAATTQTIDVLAKAAREADPSPIRSTLAHAFRLLRKNGVQLTDRRMVRAQRLVAAAATMAGRPNPTEADLWPVVLAVPTAEEQDHAREVLRDILEESESPSLSAAALDASAGPRARAARIVAAADELFAQRSEQTDPALVDGWKLKLEGLAREIDAGFAPDQLSEELVALRQKLVDEIG